MYNSIFYVFYYKKKNVPRYLLKGVENLCPPKNLNINFYTAALFMIAQTWSIQDILQ